MTFVIFVSLWFNRKSLAIALASWRLRLTFRFLLLILLAFGKISTMYSKRDTRYAAKRRAANRKRMREVVRYVAIFGFIGVLIIGTFATIVGTSILAPAGTHDRISFPHD